jgi:beta-lactamase class A
MEAGVVEFPDGGRFAVAAFVRSGAAPGVLDAALAAAASSAVESLRDLRR